MSIYNRKINTVESLAQKFLDMSATSNSPQSILVPITQTTASQKAINLAITHLEKFFKTLHD